MHWWGRVLTVVPAVYQRKAPGTSIPFLRAMHTVFSGVICTVWLCSLEWLWDWDPPTSASQVPVVQGCTTTEMFWVESTVLRGRLSKVMLHSLETGLVCFRDCSNRILESPEHNPDWCLQGMAYEILHRPLPKYYSSFFLSDMKT